MNGPWISWYKDPRSDVKFWLCKDNGDYSSYYYGTSREEAYPFASEEAARKATPTYDGSAGIERRAGVEPF